MSNTAAANHEDFLDIVQDSQSNDAVDEEEEYRIWKKNSPYLYDVLVTAGLTWPSLTVDWIRKVDESTSQLTTCRLVLGTRTDGSEPNYLMVVKVRLPITDLKKKESIDNVEALNQFKKSDKKLETECQMVHDGDVNKARSMPQPEKSNIIATFTDKGEIHIFNYFSHPLKETGDPRPDAILMKVIYVQEDMIIKYVYLMLIIINQTNLFYHGLITKTKLKMYSSINSMIIY